MSEIAIEFENISKKYGEKTVLKDVSLDIEAGLFVTILGSSGSGKTTLLKMVNRLVEPTNGTIKIYKEDIKNRNITQLRRDIGYVVQQIGLFPHVTVEKNISTVPELSGWDEAAIKERVIELMALVKLPYEEYGHRYPRQLSGGQQQRIGVARALAANPPIMLLDEPFGAVDAITRQDLQREIKNLHNGLEEKTFLFVTHDINEAIYLGDKVVIMDQGKILQYDTPHEIVRNPQTDFVKNLIDTKFEETELWGDLL
jgi:osmoprotectant transport system ATP-binding protein